MHVSTSKIIDLVRDGHLTPAEGAGYLEMQCKLRQHGRVLNVFNVVLVIGGLAAGLLLGGCGPTDDPPPAPDAGVIATPPTEPPPPACLPTPEWPCPDTGR